MKMEKDTQGGKEKQGAGKKTRKKLSKEKKVKRGNVEGNPAEIPAAFQRGCRRNHSLAKNIRHIRG